MGLRLMTAVAIFGAIVVAALTTIAVFRSDQMRLSLAELRGMYATPQSQFVDIAGMSVHYIDEGEGYPVVLIHGSEGTLHTWDGVVAGLKDRYRMIRLELPGRGLTEAAGPNDVAEDVTLHGMVMALLDHVGIEGTFHLIGQSSGGTVATRVAANYPERVNKLVVMNMPSAPVSVPRSARPPEVRRAMMINDDLLKFRTWNFWKTYYTYLWGQPERLGDDLITMMYDQNRRVRGPLARPLIPANFSPDQANRNLGAVTTPTLVIWAMNDPVLPPEQLEELTNRMTQAPKTIHQLPLTGHFPSLEAPELIVPPIAEFLAKDVAENQDGDGEEDRK